MESPLQALNLLEYSQRSDGEVSVVLTADREAEAPGNHEQILAVLEYAGAGHVIRHPCRLDATRPWTSRREVSRLAKELNALIPPDPVVLVVGEFRSPFAWALARKLRIPRTSRVVVDDGTAMLRIDRSAGLIPRNRVGLRRSLRRLVFGFAFRLIGMPATPPRSLTFFSAYDIRDRISAKDRLLANDYRCQRDALRSLPPDRERVYVIGTPHLEAGVVAHGDVELALALVAQAEDLTGLRAVYMPHRRERDEKLERIRARCDVLVPDVPFELFPLRTGVRPTQVVGYYSSLFVTLSSLLADLVRITAVDLPRGTVSPSWLGFVDEVYDEYRTLHTASVAVVPAERYSDHLDS